MSKFNLLLCFVVHVIGQTNGLQSCSSDCQKKMDNGQCDNTCNTEVCLYDGTECSAGLEPWASCVTPSNMSNCQDGFNDGVCQDHCNTEVCLYDGFDCNVTHATYIDDCVNSCVSTHDNNICNETCFKCAYDGFDCNTTLKNASSTYFATFVIRFSTDITPDQMFQSFESVFSYNTYTVIVAKLDASGNAIRAANFSNATMTIESFSGYYKIANVLECQNKKPCWTNATYMLRYIGASIQQSFKKSQMTIDIKAVKECKPGYYGFSCELACSPGCIDPLSCDIVQGQCDCKSGYFNYDCSINCNHCNAGCDSSTGTCYGGCIPGYLGTDCNQVCSHGTYGDGCSKNCSTMCYNSTCDNVNGDCTSGCIAGYTGTTCLDDCPSGTYGFNCSQKCGSCTYGTICDQINGTCPSGCQAGKQGAICNTTCFLGTYGTDCSQNCTYCVQNNCSATYGVCVYGCKAGIVNNRCSEAAFANSQFGGLEAWHIVVIVLLTVALISTAVGGWILTKRARKATYKQSKDEDTTSNDSKKQ